MTAPQVRWISQHLQDSTPPWTIRRSLSLAQCSVPQASTAQLMLCNGRQSLKLSVQLYIQCRFTVCKVFGDGHVQCSMNSEQCATWNVQWNCALCYTGRCWGKWAVVGTIITCLRWHQSGGCAMNHFSPNTINGCAMKHIKFQFSEHRQYSLCNGCAMKHISFPFHFISYLNAPCWTFILSSISISLHTMHTMQLNGWMNP